MLVLPLFYALKYGPCYSFLGRKGVIATHCLSGGRNRHELPPKPSPLPLPSCQEPNPVESQEGPSDLLTSLLVLIAPWPRPKPIPATGLIS